MRLITGQAKELARSASVGYRRNSVKIDRSFVNDLETSAHARAVVDAVIRLAYAQGLRVVGEGVETQAQCDVLLQLGCDELQGYFFAEPMAARSLLSPVAPNFECGADHKPSSTSQ